MNTQTLSTSEALVPVTSIFPGRSKRWVADACRAGRVPHAVKIGKTWMISRADAAAIGKRGGSVTVADALADLRRRGLS